MPDRSPRSCTEATVGHQRADREAAESRVGLITTEGFRDTLEIARGNRPDFFNLHYPQTRALRAPAPASRDARAHELPRRGTPSPVDLSSLPEILSDFEAEGVEAVAICFLHSYANPAHEQAVQREIGRLWPEVSVNRLPSDHARVAGVRTHQHHGAFGLRAAGCASLPRTPRFRTGGTGLRRQPLRHAVQLRCRFRLLGVAGTDHDGRVRARFGRVGRGRVGAPDRRTRT